MKQRGFTLLEIIIAVAIFLVLATLATGGLHGILQDDRHTRETEAFMADLHSALGVLQRDFMQVAARPVRGPYGDSQAALQLKGDELVPLMFSKNGWRNPAGQPRSNIQRVGYMIVDEALTRVTWRVLDQAQDSQPIEDRLLENVEDMQVRVLANDLNWNGSWPPDSEDPDVAYSLPIALEFTITVKDFGEVVRLYRLPG